MGNHLVAVRLQNPQEASDLAGSLRWLDSYPWGRRVFGGRGARWGLATNDQLVVSDDLHNPHDLIDVDTPCTVYFFRPSRDSGLSGISLIINIPGVHRLGVDHFEVTNFAECTLHTIDLGVAQRFCGTSIVTGLKACLLYTSDAADE